MLSKATSFLIFTQARILERGVPAKKSRSFLLCLAAEELEHGLKRYQDAERRYFFSIWNLWVRFITFIHFFEESGVINNALRVSKRNDRDCWRGSAEKKLASFQFLNMFFGLWSNVFRQDCQSHNIHVHRNILERVVWKVCQDVFFGILAKFILISEQNFTCRAVEPAFDAFMHKNPPTFFSNIAQLMLAEF